MRNEMVFKYSYDAHIAACFDPKCLQRSGYKLKKFVDGYRYYPIGRKRTYVIRNSQIVELGQHISTYYWSERLRYRSQFNCLVIQFRKK